MFDLDQLVADCRTAIAQDPSHKFVHEVVARVVSTPLLCLKASVSQSAAILSVPFFYALAAHGSADVRHAMR